VEKTLQVANTNPNTDTSMTNVSTKLSRQFPFGKGAVFLKLSFCKRTSSSLQNPRCWCFHWSQSY